MSKMKTIIVPKDKEEVVPESEEVIDEDLFNSSELNCEEWNGAQRMMDCPCPVAGCDGRGDTLYLLNKVPFFRELIIASFSCKKCGERNNEVSFGGEIQPKGSKISLTVTKASDLNRQIIKSDYATVTLEEMEFEIPAGTQKGEISTLEGIISQAANNLNMYQAERMEQMPEVGVKVALVIMDLRQMANGDKLPFTITVDDISGNSFIENPIAPANDPELCKTEYRRSAEQDISLGLNEETAGHSDEIKMTNNENDRGYEKLFEKSKEEADKNGRGSKMKNRANFHEDEETVSFDKDDAASLPTPCPNCAKMGEMRTAITSIPHFKEVLIMAFCCEHCGLRQSEVKGGGAVPTYGAEIILRVESIQDLKRDILKGESASIEIPELDIHLASGSLGGVYSTIEGLIHKIYTNLRDNNPFGIGDSTSLHHSEDAATDKTQFKEFLVKLKSLAQGESFPFTIIVRDALGNSFVSAPLGSFLPPEADKNLTLRDYERTAEENEEYGLNDINTIDFETGYEHEEKQGVTLPDRLTHVYEKSVDHPTPFATGMADSTPGGVFRTPDDAVKTELGLKDPELPEGIRADTKAYRGIDDSTAWERPRSERVEAEAEAEAEREEWSIDPLVYGKRHFHDDAGLKEQFKPYEEWSGAKAGMVFRLGSLGLGYYPDVRKPVEIANKSD